MSKPGKAPNGAGAASPTEQAAPRVSSTEQSERFIETARALGCDENKAAFRDKLRVIARQKPKDEPKPVKRSRGTTSRKAK